MAPKGTNSQLGRTVPYCAAPEQTKSEKRMNVATPIPQAVIQPQCERKGRVPDPATHLNIPPSLQSQKKKKGRRGINCILTKCGKKKKETLPHTNTCSLLQGSKTLLSLPSQLVDLGFQDSDLLLVLL